MQVRARRKQPNPTRFPRVRGALRVCLVCRESGQYLDTGLKQPNGEPVLAWRPRSLELVGKKEVVAPDALTKRPTKTILRLYMHAGGQTPCQSTFAAQSQKAASSQAG